MQAIAPSIKPKDEDEKEELQTMKVEISRVQALWNPPIQKKEVLEW